MTDFEFPFSITPRYAVVIAAKLFVLQILAVVFLNLAGGIGALLIPSLGMAAKMHPVELIITNTFAAALLVNDELKRLRVPWRDLGVWRIPPIGILASFLSMESGVVILIREANGWIGRYLPKPNWFPSSAHLFDMEAHPISVPLAVILMAAVTEEIVFRGLILRGLLKVCRPWPAIVISSLLFLATHLNPWQFPGTLAGGLIFGWSFVRTRSLGLCVGGHAFNNGIVLLVYGLITIGGFKLPSRATGSGFLPWWINFVGLGLLVGGAVVFNKYAPRRQATWRPLVPAVLPSSQS